MKKKDYILQKKSYVSPGIKVIDVDTEHLMDSSVEGPGQPADEWDSQKGVFFDDSWDDEDDEYDFSF